MFQILATLHRSKSCLNWRSKLQLHQRHRIKSLEMYWPTTPLELSASLPSVPQMKRTVQRVRNVINYPALTPSSLNDLVLPQAYTKTLRREDFLMFDSGPFSNRIFIFTTRRTLQLMARSMHWFADGTFKVTPSLFSQVRQGILTNYSSMLSHTLFLNAVTRFSGIHFTRHSAEYGGAYSLRSATK